MQSIILASADAGQSGASSTFQVWGVPIIIGAFFFILGLIGGVFATYSVKRPKVVLLGGGQSGELGAIRVWNSPGRVGVYIRRTVLFGRLIHRDHELGALRNGLHLLRLHLLRLHLLRLH
jgi:hypothetical protein